MEVSPEYKAIIEAIVKRRQALGWSQKEMANVLHVSQSTIGRIEAFSNIPSVETLLKIIAPLGITLTVIEK